MKKLSVILFASLAACFFSCSQAPVLTDSGLNPDDFVSEYKAEPTALFVLKNAGGMEVCITNFGGRIVSVMVPDRDGNFRDVVLGFDKITDYFPENNKSDFGACIGRYANRIGYGKFSIDGVEYQLPLNNNGHCLHGGPDGWQYKVFKVEESSPQSLKLSLVSPDGDNDFPGELSLDLTYVLTEDNRIEITYEATTDKPTVINTTNHSYFNLAGDPANCSICDDILTIYSQNVTPADSLLIPTGEIASVEGTPLDFRNPTRIGDRIDNFDFDQLRFGKGYDHNWILDACGDITKPALVDYSPVSGIRLTEYTDEPGVQVYTGNFLDGTVTGKKGVVYNHRRAVCFETQHYPDSPNKPQWPTTILRPGEKFSSRCVFAFDVVK